MKRSLYLTAGFLWGCCLGLYDCMGKPLIWVLEGLLEFFAGIIEFFASFADLLFGPRRPPKIPHVRKYPNRCLHR